MCSAIACMTDAQAIWDAYHHWFYASNVWYGLTYRGVPILKNPLDLWNYGELIHARRPRLIVELGTHAGGCALWLADQLRVANIPGQVLTVDVSDTHLSPLVVETPGLRFLRASSTSPQAREIIGLARRKDGPALFVLDSAHTAAHVLDELVMLRPIARPGDVVLVEDGNVNGHPVYPDHGPGPTEAIAEYRERYPTDYAPLDIEQRFGFTFAPGGYLERQ